MTAAAILGSLVDARNVSTHKSFRLVIDIPAEQAMKAIEAFGWPTMVNPVPVAVALIDIKAVTTKPELAITSVVSEMESRAELPGHRSWASLSPAQQAGIRCNDPAFQAFLREEGDATCDNADKAATYVRFVCGDLHSRSELNTRPAAAAKWRNLDDKFQAWMRVAA